MEKLPNQVKAHRLSRDWSQAELAKRAGISRAAVSAIEINRLVPSVAAALALAKALDCSVEDLFAGSADRSNESLWAWPPTSPPNPPPRSGERGLGGEVHSCRFWHAMVGKRTLLYPVETTAAGILEHDGVYQNGVFRTRSRFDPQQTLVIASCDPAAALLAAEVKRLRGLRVIPLIRSSQQALALLHQGLVHVAGVHLATTQSPDANVLAVQNRLGRGFRLLRVAQWQEGIALSPGSAVRTVRAAMRSKLRWIGREPGSGARQCLDELLDQRQPPRRLAPDHRGVAEAIRYGWGDAGVCLRLVSEEAGLRFLPVQKEIYEMCFAGASESDPRIHTLIETVRSASYQGLLDDLPGYEASECGEMQTVPFT